MLTEFPLFWFTTLAGLSVGLSFASAFFPPKEKPARPWLIPLCCLVLLGLGLLGVLFHLGRPELFFLGMANPTAGIAQEAYASILFGILLLAQLIICAKKGQAPKALNIIAAVAGLALACIMGFAYLANVGTSAWVSFATVPLFAIGDLCMGMGLYGLANKAAHQEKPFFLTSVVLQMLLAVTLIVEGVFFPAAGENGALFFVALAISPVAVIVCQCLANKKPAAWAPAVICACALIGVIVARWGFYAASIL